MRTKWECNQCPFKCVLELEAEAGTPDYCVAQEAPYDFGDWEQVVQRASLRVCSVCGTEVQQCIWNAGDPEVPKYVCPECGKQGG